jgi:hypothetical protein
MEIQVTYLLQSLGELYVENKLQADRLRELESENTKLRHEALKQEVISVNAAEKAIADSATESEPSAPPNRARAATP